MAWAVVAFGVMLAVRLAVAANLALVEDEAYYWTWSRHLAAGYFDHPPGIAWFIAAGTALLGKSFLGVRLVGVVAGVGAAALLLPWAKDPVRYAFLAAGIPLYALGGVLATPDVPLLAGWCLGLAGALQKRWWLAGLGVGLAGLGKYTGWGLWPLLVAAAPAEIAAMLPGMLITALLLAPNLWWNAHTEWVSLGFQVGHGLNRAPGGALNFLGAQLGLAGPVFFVLGLVWAFSQVRRIVATPLAAPDDDARADRILWFASVPVVVFFTLAATRGSGEANWAAPAYSAVALALSRVGGRMARLSWVAAGLGLALSALVTAHAFSPIIQFKGDPTARLGLGRDLARSVEAWGVEPVYTSRYQEAALLAYYGDLEAYALPGVDRPDQYDLWPIRWSEHALFVRTMKSGPSATVDDFCAERGGANVVTEANPDGSPIERWQVYEVHDCAAKTP
ncbi:glycosyl transferase [Deltaproteobacteria bacterium]|nr:glycosyl transferase [Deltaproteobacteria bacterium]